MTLGWYGSVEASSFHALIQTKVTGDSEFDFSFKKKEFAVEYKWKECWMLTRRSNQQLHLL